MNIPSSLLMAALALLTIEQPRFADAVGEGILEWLGDHPNEHPHHPHHWHEAEVVEQGTGIPDYVRGTLMRNGGGFWKYGENQFSHLFDGMAKINAWKFEGGKVYFKDRFVQSNIYQATLDQGTIPNCVGVRPITDEFGNNQFSTNAVLNLVEAFFQFPTDNPNVNLWQHDPLGVVDTDEVTAIGDTPTRATIATNDLATLYKHGVSGAPFVNPHIDEMFINESAHPMYSRQAGPVTTYNVGVYIDFLVPYWPFMVAHIAFFKEEANVQRTILKRIALKNNVGSPFIHSFGLTENFAMIVVQPMRAPVFDIFNVVSKGFLGLMQEQHKTEIIVVDLRTNEVVFHEETDERIFFAHIISTWEKSWPVTVAETHGIWPFTWTVHTQYTKNRLNMLVPCGDNAEPFLNDSKTFIDMTLNRNPTYGSQERQRIGEGLPLCTIEVDFGVPGQERIHVSRNPNVRVELTGHKFSRSFGPDVPAGRHPRFVYSPQFYFPTNGPKNFDSWGFVKVDTVTQSVVSSFYEEDTYPSEPVFIADPNGTEDDDGVILTKLHLGQDGETALLVLDAHDLSELARIKSGTISPIDFHGVFVHE